MKKTLACFVAIAILCCLSSAPAAQAGTTFAADLATYRTRNAATSEAARELTASIADERRFMREVQNVPAQSRKLLRTYRSALDQADSAVRRVIRDQRASDRLLADVTGLSSNGRTDAAWILLKRGLISQGRFLTTVARATTLMDRCRSFHARLQQAGT